MNETMPDVLLVEGPEPVTLADVLISAEIAADRAQAKLLVEMGEVKISGDLATDYKAPLPLPLILTVGSRKLALVRMKEDQQ